MGETSTPAPAGRRIRGLDADQRRAQRREALLDAALSLFAGQGYATTSIEQICQTAYVGTKSFYELFASKEACFLELLAQISEETTARLTRTLATAPDDEPLAARALLTTFAHALVDDPRRVEAAFGKGAGISPAVDARRRANRRWAAELVEAVWQRYGVAAPAGTNLHTVAVGCIGGLFDLVVDWLAERDPTVEPPPDGTAATGERAVAAHDVDDLIATLVEFYEVVRSGLADRP